VNQLEPRQIKTLKSMAHGLKPMVLIGHRGITDSLVGSVNRALDDHELIKIKFNDFKEDKRELSEQLLEKTGSTLVAIIGNVLIAYRESSIAEKKRIRV